MMGRLSVASLLTCLSAAGLGGAQAAAQEGGVERIVVTAQKRAEDINKVPLAITAVTGETLERRRIEELQQLRFIDPSLNYRQSTGPQASGFLVRGVGTSSFSLGIEQSVSTVVDGVVLSDPSSAIDLTDLERVEVLRGPQGMLFGKNASAGVVSITTHDPELGEFSGRLRGSVGTREDYQAQAVVNAPISSTLALRVSGSYRHLQESAFNRFNNQPVDPTDIRSVRVKLLWQPNDDLKAVLSTNYSYSKYFCCGVVWINDIPGYIVDYANNLYGVVPGLDNTDVAFDHQPEGKARIFGASLKVDYKLGDYTLTSVTGYQESHRLGLIDADQHAFDYLSFGGQPLDYRNVSEELRIASPTGGVFDYVAGVYYYTAHLTQTGFLAGYFQSKTPALAMPTPKTTLFSLANFTDNKYDSVALFAQGNIHLTDQLSIVVGGRYTHDEVSLFADRNALVPGSVPFNPPLTTTQSVEGDNFSWRVGPQFQVTPDVMVYASAARGYKGPGTSGSQGALINAEIPMTYEVGAKGRVFDGNLQFAVNYYHSNFKDFQAQVFDPNILATVLKNAGELETQGVELQLQGQVTPELTLGFSGAYIDAEYKDFAGVACYFRQPEPPCGPPFPGSSARVFNAAGLRLNGTPEWTYSATVDYRRPDLIEGFEVFASANWLWQDDVVYSANGDPGTRQEAFGLLGGEIGIEPQNGAWRLSVWAKNLLDKRWFSQIGAAPILTNNPGGYSGYHSPDAFRRVGVQVDIKF
ncbi:MAG: TonB-dependent receptor [Amphiplicatus sp.]